MHDVTRRFRGFLRGLAAQLGYFGLSAEKFSMSLLARCVCIGDHIEMRQLVRLIYRT